MIRALFLLLALCCTSSVAATPRFDRAGDWSLICDENSTCTIIGIPDLPNQPGNVRIAVSILRGNEPGAPNYLRMLLIRWDGVPVEDQHLYGFHLAGPDGGLMLDASGDMAQGINFFFPAQSAQLIDWFARHRPAQLLQEGQPFARLPAGNLARLLRIRDQRQPAVAQSRERWAQEDEHGRVNFEIFPREQEPLDALPPQIPRECPGATPADSPAYGIDHTTSPTLMLVVPCGKQAAIFTWFRDGAPVRQNLSDPIAQRYSHSTVDYDDDQGLLTFTFTNGRRQDCGYRSQWAWVDGEGFMRLQAWWMPDCRGLPPILWPQIFNLTGWFVR
jgi:hypothetical protein